MTKFTAIQAEISDRGAIQAVILKAQQLRSIMVKAIGSR